MTGRWFDGGGALLRTGSAEDPLRKELPRRNKPGLAAGEALPPSPSGSLDHAERRSGGAVALPERTSACHPPPAPPSASAPC